ncbi:hypothetical protein PYCCODRAFT_1130589 [Trametes coccinea BRFM310]|uniref:Uncharacterized protein n=1 Tax=Trametes coccinea (strain BRFM310) TaxID=1353009 RepID=A0A1Y2I8Q1_TRAC3|nr:hypothetical protein PYCCODRAFT_1130589 [Trametes coccinea BRFM310]
MTIRQLGDEASASSRFLGRTDTSWVTSFPIKYHRTMRRIGSVCYYPQKKHLSDAAPSPRPTCSGAMWMKFLLFAMVALCRTDAKRARSAPVMSLYGTIDHWRDKRSTGRRPFQYSRLWSERFTTFSSAFQPCWLFGHNKLSSRSCVSCLDDFMRAREQSDRHWHAATTITNVTMTSHSTNFPWYNARISASLKRLSMPSTCYDLSAGRIA